MTPVEFAKAWLAYESTLDIPLDGLVRFAGARPSAIDDDSWEYLSVSGLPSSAPPFLSFDAVAKLGSVADVYGADAIDPAANVDMLRIIGSDGAGNPLAVNLADGTVIWLDHETAFSVHAFVNSSLRALAASLLTVALAPSRNPGLGAICKIDPRAGEEGAFWEAELRSLGTARGQAFKRSPLT